MMKSLGEILKNTLPGAALRRGVSAAGIIEATDRALEQVLGAGSRDHAAALYVKNNYVTIACRNSIVAQEIKLQEAAIVERLTGAVGPVNIIGFHYTLSGLPNDLK